MQGRGGPRPDFFFSEDHWPLIENGLRRQGQNRGGQSGVMQARDQGALDQAVRSGCTKHTHAPHV